MSKLVRFISFFTLILLLTACEKSTQATAGKGFHFQGRDCLACHNVDLQDERQLHFGATLYSDTAVTSDNALEKACNADLVVNFISSDKNISTKDFVDTNSKGYLGRGNIFLLSRLHEPLNGNFSIQITTTSGTLLAQSGVHNFNGADYNINNSANTNNRVSCNACHIAGGQQSVIHAQQNQTLCN